MLTSAAAWARPARCHTASSGSSSPRCGSCVRPRREQVSRVGWALGLCTPTGTRPGAQTGPYVPKILLLKRTPTGMDQEMGPLGGAKGTEGWYPPKRHPAQLAWPSCPSRTTRRHPSTPGKEPSPEPNVLAPTLSSQPPELQKPPNLCYFVMTVWAQSRPGAQGDHPHTGKDTEQWAAPLTRYRLLRPRDPPQP